MSTKITTTLVQTTAADGSPALEVEFLGQNAAPAVTLDAGQAGSSIVDPQSTTLAGGQTVVTWVSAFSHSLQAEFALLSATGAVLAQNAYGHGYTTGFDAIALANGGFMLADAESDLFGRSATLTAQTMSATGVATGSATTVASGSSANGGLSYMDVSGVASRSGVELSWDDLNGSHSAFVSASGGSHQAAQSPAVALVASSPTPDAHQAFQHQLAGMHLHDAAFFA